MVVVGVMEVGVMVEMADMVEVGMEIDGGHREKVDMEEAVEVMVNMGEVGIMVEVVDTGEVMEVAMAVTVEMQE